MTLSLLYDIVSISVALFIFVPVFVLFIKWVHWCTEKIVG